MHWLSSRPVGLPLRRTVTAPMFWSPSDSPRGLMSICLMSRLAGWPAVKGIVLGVWSWPCAVTASAAPPIRAADVAMAIVVCLMLVLLVGWNATTVRAPAGAVIGSAGDPGSPARVISGPRIARAADAGTAPAAPPSCRAQAFARALLGRTDRRWVGRAGRY